MAYVRRKGNQLAIVHGVRNAETKQVEQKTLFCLYSKAEALAAVGDQKHHFRHIVAAEGPGIRFDWTKIEAGIRDNLEHLPDLYAEYKSVRVQGDFRAALVAFARELILADPQTLLSSARLIEENRHELAFLDELIGWRLKLCEQAPNEWNKDNPFYWRSASARQEVPPDQEEQLGELFARGAYDEAEALARLLIACWPNFAPGFNTLGRIALERERLEAAVAHFDGAMRVGRALFPKRIAKDRYWSDHDTRPYIRAIIYQTQALNRLERYEEALALCDRLDEECAQDISAACQRIAPYLNTGQWALASASARFVHKLYPDYCFPLAFALFEEGERREATVYFLHAALRFPRAARMLTGVRRAGQPKTSEDIDDHNTGVHWQRDLAPYLGGWQRRTKPFFSGLVQAA